MNTADMVANIATDRILREIPALAELVGWGRDKARESLLTIVADAVEDVAHAQFADAPQS